MSSFWRSWMISALVGTNFVQTRALAAVANLTALPKVRYDTMQMGCRPGQ
jgi:hypothetical protein